jgi:hypothetical protein
MCAMVAKATTIRVDPDSELARIVEQAAERPIRLRLGDAVFRLEREDRPDRPDADPSTSVWDGYDPEAARAGILAAAGGWRGLVDGEELKAYIRERRKTKNRPDVTFPE